MFLGPKEFLLYPLERDPPMAERLSCEWNTRANGNVGSHGMRPWFVATKEASEALLRNAVLRGPPLSMMRVEDDRTVRSRGILPRES